MPAKFSKLPPKAFYMGVHGAAVPGITQLPNASQQLSAGEDLVAVLQEIGEELEFPRSEEERFSVEGGPAAAAVYLQPITPQNVLFCGDGLMEFLKIAYKGHGGDALYPGDGDVDREADLPLLQL